MSAPALFLGVLFLLTSGSALYPHWSYVCGFLPLLLLLIREKAWKMLFASCTAALIFFTHLCFYTSAPVTLEEKVLGRGHFEIENVRVTQSPFNQSYLYQGILRSFIAEDGRAWKNLPCHLYLPINKARPKADIDYEIRGTLSQKAPHAFVLKPLKEQAWEPISASFRFAEWRYNAKEKVRLFLKKQLPHPRVFTFFVALVIGDLDERMMSMEFAKLGLQHILGISGFHFVLLAGFFGCILRLFFPFKITACILLTLLTAYFFFVGTAPATLRGWIAISVYLLARLFHLPTSALNALGVGLCVEIFYSPFVVTSIGFQLSFLCTWAILLLYPLMRRGITPLFPKRSLQEVSELSIIRQHTYLLSSLFREAIALNLAVHLASLPLILFLFHKFPLQSLLYNLFFPFCFSVSLLLLLTGILVTCLIPPLGKLIHLANSAFTSLLLDMAAAPSLALDLPLRVRDFPFGILIGVLALLFCGAHYLRQREKC